MAVLLIFSGAGAAGYLFAAGEPRVVKPSNQAPTAVQAGANDERVAKDATVSWDYYYKMCEHHIYLDCPADENMVGLSFSQLQTQYPDVRIVSFDPKKICLQMSFDCYCPDHYILKHYKDELAVLKTIFGTGDQEIFLEVPIKFDQINADERKVLEAGKLFNSLDELESYFESLET